jgi:polar amino acid transport system substrate-binding protein
MGGNIVKSLTLGMVLGAALLASVNAANAQQGVVKVGYAPFGAPLTSLPTATTENYRTFDPKGVMAQGAMIDVMNAIAKDAGIQIQYVASAVGDRVADLNGHVIDMMISGAPEPPTAITALIDFGEPIYNNGDSLVVLKSDTKQYTSWEDLRGEVVAVQRNTAEDGSAQSSGLFKEVKVYPDGNAAAQAVSTGQAKAYLDASAVASSFNFNPATGSPQNLALGLRDVTSYKVRFPSVNKIAVAKGNTQLLAKLNASAAKLKANGTIKAIFAKYGLDGLLVN